MAAPSASAVRVPQAPVSTPVSSKTQAEFQQLKRSLDHLASWELTPASWDELPMRFSETGNPAQAQALIQALE